MRFSVVLLAFVFMLLTMECYGRSRKGYRRRRLSYRRRRYTGCRYITKVDCIVGPWQPWRSCTDECGSSGIRRRTRYVIRPARCNGKPCPFLTEEQACNRKCDNGGIPKPGYCSCRAGYSGKCCQIGGGQGYGFCSSKPDGVYGNPKDCTSFYHCANGQTHLKYCPDGLHWNIKAKTCDWSEDAKCGKGKCTWKKWSPWSRCSAKCGCGSKKRSRKCSCDSHSDYDKRGLYGHQEVCHGKGSEEAECNCNECPGGNVNTESVGCFCDKTERALPDLVAKFHGSTAAKHKISSCAHLAKRLQVEYFGMQFNGECWVDLSGVNDYGKYGKSSSCKDGIGRVWANFVYKIVQ